jgi:hypothetical protein
VLTSTEIENPAIASEFRSLSGRQGTGHFLGIVGSRRSVMPGLRAAPIAGSMTQFELLNLIIPRRFTVNEIPPKLLASDIDWGHA